MNKLNYFLNAVLHYNSDKGCPYCSNETNNKIIDRKFFATRLFECNNCGLYFRHPKDSVSFNKAFYQKAYKETDITRNIPSIEQLEIFKKDNFRGSGKDYSDKVSLFKALFYKPVKELKVVDYGCSWGYASYQFKKEGFLVQSFEISTPMADQGKKLLNIDIKSSADLIEADNDIFFSAHVIEHMPDIKIMINDAKRLLKKQGLFICYCPNGSKEFEKKHPQDFHKIWGLVHPSYINPVFFTKIFSDNPYLLTSSNKNLIEQVRNWDQQSQLIKDLDGDELIAVVKINEVYR
jgi:2-polyprenyl-3-methyl-5-hydroxy-6-metoxy-1,4-benzoquinol methylase